MESGSRENRLEKIKSEISDLRYQSEKIDGEKGPRYKILNSVMGLGRMVFGAWLAYEFQSPEMDSGFSSDFFSIFLSLYAIEGLGEALTGKHRYLSFRLLHVHPKYKIEKLEKELGEIPN